jgi:hypothetical protein
MYELAAKETSKNSSNLKSFLTLQQMIEFAVLAICKRRPNFEILI